MSTNGSKKLLLKLNSVKFNPLESERSFLGFDSESKFQNSNNESTKFSIEKKKRNLEILGKLPPAIFLGILKRCNSWFSPASFLVIYLGIPIKSSIHSPNVSGKKKSVANYLADSLANYLRKLLREFLGYHL